MAIQGLTSEQERAVHDATAILNAADLCFAIAFGVESGSGGVISNLETPHAVTMLRNALTSIAWREPISVPLETRQ